MLRTGVLISLLLAMAAPAEEIIIDGRRLSDVKPVRISGTVRCACHGQPMPGIQLQCEGPNGRERYHLGAPYETYSDDEGRYAFTNLLPDAYTISARVCGDFTTVAGELPHLYEDSAATLDLRIPGGGVFEGTVIDADTGLPLPGVRVDIAPSPKSGPPYDGMGCPAETDPSGHFKFVGLEEQRFSYHVWTRDILYKLADSSIPNIEIPSHGHVKTEIRVVRAWKINVTVVDKNGKSVENIWVASNGFLPDGTKLRGSSQKTATGKANFIGHPSEAYRRIEVRIPDSPCGVTQEIRMPENRVSKIVLTLPCAKADLPPAPDFPPR